MFKSFSTIQLEGFRSHHVIATVLAENAPQLALQYYFMFKLDVINSIVIVSFMSSIFNILLVIMSMIVFLILYRNQKEVPFTVNISWKRIGFDSVADLEHEGTRKTDFDPFSRCGRRRELSKELEALNVDHGALKFEVLSTQKHRSSATIYGVFVTEQSVNTRPRSRSEGRWCQGSTVYTEWVPWCPC